MKKIKAITLDLDGTLLNNQKEITEYTVRTLKKAKEYGIKVVLCTGRPLKGILHLLKQLELTEEGDIAIAFNGGLIQYVKSNEVLYQATLSKEDIVYIYHQAYQVGLPTVMIDLEYVYETNYPTNFPSLYPSLMTLLSYQTKQPEDFNENHRFNKALLCTETEQLDKGIAQLPKEFFERFNCFKSRPILLEVVPKEVSKGKALHQLASILGITTDEIMACGDEANDYDMIQTAGFGVAMGNATDEIKKIADYITTTNEEDGVAKAVEYIIEMQYK